MLIDVLDELGGLGTWGLCLAVAHVTAPVHRQRRPPNLARRGVLRRQLVRWFQQLCLTGPLASAEPKTLRWGLWHTPARLVHLARRRVVRILDGWPATIALLDAAEPPSQDDPRPLAVVDRERQDWQHRQ